MNVVWDREVVYESVWSLLCEVEGRNRASASASASKPEEKEINRLLMTPQAAGIGKVSKERWSAQMVLAMKHFVDAVERPERWSRMQWNEIMKDCDEVATTWKTGP